MAKQQAGNYSELDFWHDCQEIIGPVLKPHGFNGPHFLKPGPRQSADLCYLGNHLAVECHYDQAEGHAHCSISILNNHQPPHEWRKTLQGRLVRQRLESYLDFTQNQAKARPPKKLAKPSARQRRRLTLAQVLRKDLSRQAELLKQASQVLNDDAEIFADLEKHSKRQERLHLLQATRQQAERAWRLKDYPTLLSLYQSIRADLKPLELKRLSYAQKQI